MHRQTKGDGLTAFQSLTMRKERSDEECRNPKKESRGTDREKEASGAESKSETSEDDSTLDKTIVGDASVLKAQLEEHGLIVEQILDKLRVLGRR